MENMLNDYGVPHNDASPSMTLHCDNINAINISKNPVQHSQTKHIHIHHHFIRSLVEDKVIEVKHIPIEHQLADIFTFSIGIRANHCLKLLESEADIFTEIDIRGHILVNC